MGFTYRKYPEEFLTSKGGRPFRIYMVWYDMIKRCKKDSKDRKNYYDRGISVCSEWEYWPVFATWARNNGYNDDLELDRKDNNLGYFPENCRFSTELIQARNIARERHSESGTRAQRIFHENKFMCLETGEIFKTQAECSEITGVCRSVLSSVLSFKRKTARGFLWKYLSEMKEYMDGESKSGGCASAPCVIT